MISKAAFLQIPGKSFICLGIFSKCPYGYRVHSYQAACPKCRGCGCLQHAPVLPEARRGPAGRGRLLWGSREQNRGDKPGTAPARVTAEQQERGAKT